jgi:hypothetical protein
MAKTAKKTHTVATKSQPANQNPADDLVSHLHRMLGDSEAYGRLEGVLNGLSTDELEDLADTTRELFEDRKKKERADDALQDEKVKAFRKKFNQVRGQYEGIEREHKVELRLNIPLEITSVVRLKGGNSTTLEELVDPDNHHLNIGTKAEDWRDMMDIYVFETDVPQGRGIDYELATDLTNAAEKSSDEWCPEGKLKVLSKKLDKRFINTVSAIYQLREDARELVLTGKYQFEDLVEETKE